MSLSKNKRRLLIAATLVACVGVAFALFHWLSPVEHSTTGSAERTVIVDCDFDKFRMILVRKPVTKAIVANGGMQLESEQIEQVQLDASNDERPVINALLGRSQTDLSAVKRLVVRLDRPDLEAEQLILRQHSQFVDGKIRVETLSVEPAGRLEKYDTILSAHHDPRGTELTVSVKLRVRVRVPQMFVGEADRQVQQAADDAIEEQVASLKSFVAEHVGEVFALP